MIKVRGTMINLVAIAKTRSIRIWLLKVSILTKRETVSSSNLRRNVIAMKV